MRLLWLSVLLAALMARADSTVTFSEVMYHPSSSESLLEWVELHNEMSVDMDLSGWSLTNGVNFTFPNGTILGGGAYAVIATSPATVQGIYGLTNVLGPLGGRLSNSGETIELRNNSHRLMDEVSFKDEDEWPVGPDGSGASLAKGKTGLASADPVSWSASPELGGTPGRINFPAIGFVPFSSVLVPENASWSYRSANGDPTWPSASFDDSGWQTGPGILASTNAVIEPGPLEEIATLFSTGLDAARTVRIPGSSDLHYVVTAAPAGVPPPPYPATVVQNHPAWLANDFRSSWIGITNPGTTSIPAGRYDFRTSFDLTGYEPATASIQLAVSSDNEVSNVFLNGVSTGVRFDTHNAWSPTYSLQSGFRPGTNQLDFHTLNWTTSPNPGGFRALLNGVARKNRQTQTIIGPSSVTHYFRTRFLFNGDPLQTECRLRLLVDDGAVAYLNGNEIARLNLPSGPVTDNLQAVTNVATARFHEFTFSPGANLVAGTNVLAVGVHQANGGSGDLVFAAELLSRTIPILRPPVVFNEISAGTNSNFFIELANRSSGEISLTAWSITLDGAANGRFQFPSNAFLAAGGVLHLSAAEMGFLPRAGDRLFLFSAPPVLLVDAIDVTSRSRARYPDASGPWMFQSLSTFGQTNSAQIRNDVVMNEIMYHHAPAFLSSTQVVAVSEAWIELHNRSSTAVDLSGWDLDEGIDFVFPAGTTIPAGGFLVIANNRDALSALYPGIAIVGNFTNRLSHGGERVVLRDQARNPVDQVFYRDSFPWPELPDGGGSSLELIDARSDNNNPASWAASDESNKSAWRLYSYDAIATTDYGPTRWNEFILGLLEAGEVLIDDLIVTESPNGTPRPMISNGNFESGGTGWRWIGNHRFSSIIPEPGNPANKVLHLVATGPTEHMHNHIETTLASGATVVNGRTYRIQYRAKWLRGSPQLNTRLYFNRVAKTTWLDQPSRNGTPGAANSQSRTNAGPVFEKLSHSPATPTSSNPVSISVEATDPDGISACVLWWSSNGTLWTQTPMIATGNNSYRGIIPPHAAGNLIQFYVEAVDVPGASATSPAAGRASRALYRVEDGSSQSPTLNDLQILMTPADANWLHAPTNVMSNDRMRATVLYNGEPVYDVAIHLQASQRGRVEDNRVGFTLEFPSDHLFRGVHDTITLDRSGGWSGRGGRQDEIVMKHIIHRAGGGVPGMYDDLVYVVTPKPQHNGVALLLMTKFDEPEFLESQYGSDEGDAFKLELVYYPLSTIDGAVTSPKLPQPDDVLGTGIIDRGDDKELYRWQFLLENERDRDNYAPVIALADAFALPDAAFDARTREILDVDEWMRAFAFKALSGDGDTFGFGYPHNFMILFRPGPRGGLAVPWDMDFAWARSPTDSLVPGDSVGRLVNLPGNRRWFFAHLLDIVTTTYNTAYMSRWTSHYGTMAGQNYSGVLSYIGQRAVFVQSQMPARTAFTLATTNAQNFIVNLPLATVTGSGWLDIKEIRLAGTSQTVTQRWTGMQSWEVKLPVVLGTNAHVLVAYDFRGNAIATQTVHITSSAAFGAPDSDGDRMPDAWELRNFLNPADAQDAVFDFDGDGLSNQQEYLTGTSPWDASSTLSVTLENLTPTTADVSVRTEPGRTYALEYSDDFRTWSALATIPAGVTGQMRLVTDSTRGNSNHRFYRVVLRF